MPLRSAIAWILLAGAGAGAGCSASTRSRPPEADGDRDGVPDRADRCPNEPEDYDGDRDDDGCPDSDDSGEILDVDDRCPIVLDCEEGFVDYDGCPDVILVFERDATALTARHLKTLDELADELQYRKKVKRLRIDGLFAAGEDPSLAEQRSKLVRDRLVALGVRPDMLETRVDSSPGESSGFVSFFALECAE